MFIKKLPELIIAQIAAGEVIESPVSVIKELVENALDAESTQIEILIENQGLSYIQIRDNGKGISKEDLPMALEGFATSKLEKTDDLYNILTMGFRGEALSSIKSISKITIESRERNSSQAWKITAEGADVSEVQPSAYPEGTRINVENLFFNVPIRKKFLAGETKIRQQIIETITSYAIINYNVSFLLSIDGSTIINTRTADSLEERISQVYSSKFIENMTGIYFQNKNVQISGLISGSGFHHSRPSFIKTYVNKRPVEFNQLIRLLKRIYGELLPPGKYPAAFLFIEINPSEIDVNVHPQKKEIRFKQEQEFMNIIENVIKKGIENKGALNLQKKFAAVGKKNEARQEYRTNQLFDISQTISVNETPRNEYKIDLEEQPDFNKGIEFIPQFIHSSLFNTFIIATSESGLFLIDQHTAHERIQYENYKDMIRKKDQLSQTLLDPVTILLSGSELDILKKFPENFSSLGFEFEDFGPAGIRINSVPAFLSKGQEEEALKTIIELTSNNLPVNKDELFDKMVKSMSCRSAVKKGESVSQYDHTKLIEKLYKCKEPLRCPHGRPTVIYFSKDDIFKLFNRPTVRNF